MDPTKRLIEMVKSRPCLWDRSCQEYRDKYAKGAAWVEIYKAFEPNYDDMKSGMKHMTGVHITKKWYNIRDSYVKSVKNVHAYTGLGKRHKPYIYAEQLSFLEPVYGSDKIKPPTDEDTSFDITDKSLFKRRKGSEDKSEEETEQWIDEVFVDFNEGAPVASSKSRDTLSETGPPHDTERYDEKTEDIVKVLTGLIQKEEDEDRAFFKSIIPSVKRLTEDGKMEFRIEVMKLLKTLKAKYSRPKMKTERVSIDSGGDSE